MSDQIVEVWLGAFGEPKPYGAQPGDAWVSARVLARKANGTIWAKRLGGMHTNWVPKKYWREVSDAP